MPGCVLPQFLGSSSLRFAPVPQVWEIYFGDISEPICYKCPAAAAPKPKFKAIPEEQCNIACADRDGW